MNRWASLITSSAVLGLLVGGPSRCWARFITIKRNEDSAIGNTYYTQIGAVLRLPDGSTVTMERDTTLSVQATTTEPLAVSGTLRLVAAHAATPAAAEGTSGSFQLILQKGIVWEELRPGNQVLTQTSPSVPVPGAAATVQPLPAPGTGMKLNVTLDDSTGIAALTVFEGDVRFRNAAGAQDVHRAEWSVARPGQRPTPPVSINLPFIVEWPEDIQSVSPPAARAAVRSAPGSIAAYAGLVRALLDAGNIDEAASAAREAVRLLPDQPRAQFLLGVALAEQRRLDAAILELERIRAAAPDYAYARTFLARLYLAQDRTDDANRVIQALRQVNPGFAPSLAVLGQLSRTRGRLAEAASRYEAALALEPASPLFRLELAQVYLDMNYLPDALAQALLAVHTAPYSSEAHGILGLVYDRQGNRQQAEDEYREALSLNPDNSLARLGLVTSFTPPTFGFFASGDEQLRERAQALLRDPAVLQQVFKPGVTSEISGTLDDDPSQAIQYLHRGQSSRGRVNDLTVGSYLTDDGYRPNSSMHNPMLRSDVAVQAAPGTQLLLQSWYQALSGGLPGPRGFQIYTRPYVHVQRTDYNLLGRQSLGRGRSLWIRFGTRFLSNSRGDPSFSDPPDRILGATGTLLGLRARRRENALELRIDQTAGTHRLTYGLMTLADHLRTGEISTATGDRPYDSSREADLTRDWLQYVEDEYRWGSGSLNIGVQVLRTKDQVLARAQDGQPQDSYPAVRHDEVLPHLLLSYPVGHGSLLRVLGYQSRVRFSGPLLEPVDALIVGEPVNVFYNGRLATSELDYEHRFSRASFVKLFVQRTSGESFTISPLRDESLPTRFLIVPKVLEGVLGLRIEHQVSRYMEGFARLAYVRADDRSTYAYNHDGTAVQLAGQQAPNRARGLQVPFTPVWQGTAGLNFVDRSGTKLDLSAEVSSSQYIDVVGPNGVTQDAGNQFGGLGFERTLKRASIGPRARVDVRIAKEPSVRMEYGMTIANLLNTNIPDWSHFPGRGRILEFNVAWRF